MGARYLNKLLGISINGGKLPFRPCFNKTRWVQLYLFCKLMGALAPTLTHPNDAPAKRPPKWVIFTYSLANVKSCWKATHGWNNGLWQVSLQAKEGRISNELWFHMSRVSWIRGAFKTYILSSFFHNLILLSNCKFPTISIEEYLPSLVDVSVCILHSLTPDQKSLKVLCSYSAIP